MKRLYIILLSGIISIASIAAQSKEQAKKKGPEIMQQSSAWRIATPLGERIEAPVDTLHYDYAQRSIPSAQSIAYATTGNLGTEGYDLIYFDRPDASDFFFRDALRAWLPSIETQRFYNTRIPMTLASYNFGGGKETTQDRLRADFSGNINARAQIGAMVDYLYSKGSFNYQAAKHLSWGLSGSYIGDRFEFQGFIQHFNSVNKENGGITDERYITNPAEIQGGSTSVDYKTIPTLLSDAHNRLVGTQLLLNSRYKVGFYKEVADGDSVKQEYVPVSSFIWTLDYKRGRHMFRNENAADAREFWENTYLNEKETIDRTYYYSIKNTLGVSLLEGFHKYAQAGLAVFLTHEYRHYTLPEDNVDRKQPLPETLTPLPMTTVPTTQGENYAWVGAQLTRRQGRILNYDATGRIGILGEAIGEVEVNGNIYTHIPFCGDTLNVTAYGSFTNVSVPYLLQHYISNHFAWDNDFGMTRKVRFGGSINLPSTATTVSAGVENAQNLVYFNDKALPTQCGSSVQVFSASLKQDFRFGIFNWHNKITYQTSTDEAVIPLPKLAVYSNMFIDFKVARVLDVQLGIDCDYYTKYKSVAYQPATMAFYNQREADCGNHPFVNAYINFKLSKTRFYVMFSHLNQGLFGGDNWFAMPGYPLNPRRFQLGLSIDFAD